MGARGLEGEERGVGRLRRAGARARAGGGRRLMASVDGRQGAARGRRPLKSHITIASDTRPWKTGAAKGARRTLVARCRGGSLGTLC